MVGRRQGDETRGAATVILNRRSDCEGGPGEGADRPTPRGVSQSFERPPCVGVQAVRVGNGHDPIQGVPAGVANDQRQMAAQPRAARSGWVPW